MHFLVLFGVTVSVALANGAALESDVIDEEGLYSKNDHVLILGKRNFDKKVYGQNHALVVQFYNSFCGHCRKFAPKYKALAADIVPWNAIIRPAAIDCNVEDNIAICRDFEIMAYPTLRYFHENYQKGSTGDRLANVDSYDRVKTEIIAKMQSEQAQGRLTIAPPLQLGTWSTLTSALQDVPHDVKYTFLIFETEESNVGVEVILATHDYPHVTVKRISSSSPLAPSRTPALLAVKNTLDTTALTPQNPTGQNLLFAIKTFLKSKNFVFPEREEHNIDSDDENSLEVLPKHDEDVVYYSDLETTLRTVLHTEITRYKVLTAEAREALLNFLDVVISSFPFKGPSRGREFIMELRDVILSRNNWNGADLADLIKRLETKHAPVYITNLKYVSCKGSQTRFRGYSCGLWTLFHTLTVNAARLPGTEGPRVLRAMHGYVKNFFGCTDCADHFQAMAARNRLFEVTENDKAVLWLWISHNEVNLRLAGDETEDPDFPKIQFPSAARCPECRLARGAWSLPAVLRYLGRVYAAEAVLLPAARGAAPSPAASPFSALDYGMLSLLYISSFLILLLVVKLFLSKRLYRKRIYKHDGLGKV